MFQHDLRIDQPPWTVEIGSNSEALGGNILDGYGRVRIFLSYGELSDGEKS